MTVKVHAIYEKGALHPSDPLPLAEGEHVELTLDVVKDFEIRPTDSAYEQLLRVANLPSEGPNDGFSGADHDRILYGDVNGPGDVR